MKNPQIEKLRDLVEPKEKDSFGYQHLPVMRGAYMNKISEHNRKRGMRPHVVPIDIDKVNREYFDVAKAMKRKRFLSYVNAGRIARTSLVVQSREEAERVLGETLHWHFSDNQKELNKIRMSGQLLVCKHHNLDEARRRVKERPFSESLSGFVGLKDGGGYAKQRHGIKMMDVDSINI